VLDSTPSGFRSNGFSLSCSSWPAVSTGGPTHSRAIKESMVRRGAADENVTLLTGPKRAGRASEGGALLNVVIDLNITKLRPVQGKNDEERIITIRLTSFPSRPCKPKSGSLLPHETGLVAAGGSNRSATTAPKRANIGKLPADKHTPADGPSHGPEGEPGEPGTAHSKRVFMGGDRGKAQLLPNSQRPLWAAGQ
jgi:hypothetical protein